MVKSFLINIEVYYKDAIMKNDKDVLQTLERIYRSDSSEIEKMAEAFGYISGVTIEQSANQIELLTAMSDEENLIKEHIKHGVIKMNREWFNEIYRNVTGKKAWDE
jgi:hypothetical protein